MVTSIEPSEQKIKAIQEAVALRIPLKTVALITGKSERFIRSCTNGLSLIGDPRKKYLFARVLLVYVDIFKNPSNNENPELTKILEEFLDVKSMKAFVEGLVATFSGMKMLSTNGEVIPYYRLLRKAYSKDYFLTEDELIKHMLQNREGMFDHIMKKIRPSDFGWSTTLTDVETWKSRLTLLVKETLSIDKAPVTSQGSIALLKIRMREVLDTLNIREQKILGLLFGWSGDVRSMAQIARELNISSSLAGQSRDRALRKLKHPSRSSLLRIFIEDYSNFSENIWFALKEDKYKYEKEYLQISFFTFPVPIQTSLGKGGVCSAFDLVSKPFEYVKGLVEEDVFDAIARRVDSYDTENRWKEFSDHVALLDEKDRFIERLQANVRDFDLPKPTWKRLEKAGIDTVGLLLRYSDSDLLKIPVFGQGSLNKIKKALVSQELNLGMILDPSVESLFPKIKLNLSY